MAKKQNKIEMLMDLSKRLGVDLLKKANTLTMSELKKFAEMADIMEKQAAERYQQDAPRVAGDERMVPKAATAPTARDVRGQQMGRRAMGAPSMANQQPQGPLIPQPGPGEQPGVQRRDPAKDAAGAGTMNLLMNKFGKR